MQTLNVAEYQEADGMQQQYPNFVDTTVYVANLEKGDCVYMPGGWVSQLEFEDEEQSGHINEKLLISYNYGPASPWLNMGHS